MVSLSKEVKDLFEPRTELHKVRIQAAQVLNADEWASYKKVTKEFEKERSTAQSSFEKSFDGLVAKTTQKLINEAGSVKRRFAPRGMGSDGFNRDQIRRQAKLEVKSAHKSEMAKIDQRETEATRLCLDKALQRGQQREKLIGDFQTATDRRHGQERRARSWSR